MNIKYTYSWLMSSTETIIEISDHSLSKGLCNVRLIDTSPSKTFFELPDDDRLDSIVSSIKQLRDGELNSPSNIALDSQTLSISGVGYFKWYGTDLPTEWKSLQILVKYLQRITNNLTVESRVSFS